MIVRAEAGLSSPNSQWVSLEIAPTKQAGRVQSGPPNTCPQRCRRKGKKRRRRRGRGGSAARCRREERRPRNGENKVPTRASALLDDFDIRTTGSGSTSAPPDRLDVGTAGSDRCQQREISSAAGPPRARRWARCYRRPNGCVGERRLRGYRTPAGWRAEPRSGPCATEL